MQNISDNQNEVMVQLLDTVAEVGWHSLVYQSESFKISVKVSTMFKMFVVDICQQL